MANVEGIFCTDPRGTTPDEHDQALKWLVKAQV